MTQYIKFELSPGQQAPKGSTSRALLDGWIVWVGEKDTFSPFAKFGRILTSDNEPSSKIESKEMTEKEIQEYKDIVAGKYDIEVKI